MLPFFVTCDSLKHLHLTTRCRLIDSRQAVLAQGRAGQPTQTEDVGPLQGRLWCHHVLHGPIAREDTGNRASVSLPTECRPQSCLMNIKVTEPEVDHVCRELHSQL